MMRHIAPAPRRARGFTLVEAVVVIVIIGIIGAIVAVFIRAPMLGYTDTVARAAASDEADLALRRMAREIRLALPNSVRVSPDGDAIEFLLTTTGGRYLAVEDDAAGMPLDFVGGGLRFTVVGGLRADVLPGQFVAVYNLGPGMGQADAYTLGNMAPVRDLAPAGGDAIVLAANPFAANGEPMPSPGRRFQVVDGPVMYRCEVEAGAEAEEGGFVLRRYAGYSIAAAMPGRPAGGRGAVLARRVAACANVFSYGEADLELRRSALVLLSLALRASSAADPAERTVRLVHQVHVDNTP